MAAKAPYKSISIKPVDGLLDTRLTPDEVPVGGYRYVESWECLQRGKMCRMSGHKRLLDTEFTNNADLHDQLLSITGRSLRQPILFLHEHQLPGGAEKLFAASANVLYALNNSTGNWKVIWDECSPGESTGCAEVRWSAGGFGDTLVFSNGVDPVQAHVVDQPPIGAGQQSVAPVSDLVLLNVTRAGFIKQFAGLTLYCDVVQDGKRKSYRILWSDYQNPLSVKPKASASLAGYKDLDDGEVILNAEELGNSLLVYTNFGIWQVDVGGDAGLAFTKRYPADRPGDRCLRYARTLVSTGSEHYFFANDGIYMMSQYVVKPERIDWIHKASATIFDDLNTGRCLAHCAGHQVEKKQIWFSWAKSGEACPHQSFVINLEFPFVSFVPEGFTAFGNFSFLPQQSLRQFLIERCFCDADGLESVGLGFVKEGGWCGESGDPDAGDCTPPTCLFSTSTVTLDGRVLEDLNAAVSSQSACHALAGFTLADLCQSEQSANRCAPSDLFIAATASDLALKQTDPAIYYRELCISAEGCGTYQKSGYRSVLRSGPMDLNFPEQEKVMDRFAVEAFPEEQTVPSVLQLKVGSAAQANDPNKFDRNGRCVIMYEQQEGRPLVCASDASAAEHEAAGTRPDEDLAWATHMTGRYLYYELAVENPTANPPDTGGAVCLSRFTFRIRLGPAMKP